MFALDRIVNELSDEQLKQGYDELIELTTTGILCNGLVRECDAKFRSEIPNQQFSITVLEKAFLHEIVRRYYSNK
jgi:hypothetical protein